MSSRPVLHFYQVSSIYCEGYLNYRADTTSKSSTRKGDNSKSKKARVVILVRDTLSHPVLIEIFQRVFDLQRGHEINAYSLSNIRKGDNAKSKKGRVVILVCDTLSSPVLHLNKYLQNISKGIPVTERTGNLFQTIQREITPKVRIILVHDTSTGPVLHFY